jgi:tetraacyldisaccharide 4'-kinase
MNARLQAQLRAAWLHRGLLAIALLPLSLLLSLLSATQRQMYRWRWLPSRQPKGTVVVVVGNVIAGGAGKTPVTMTVVEHLLSCGYSVGVVSRGYGRSSRSCLEVMANSLASDTGDEPLLIKRKCAVPVFVAPKRLAAAIALKTRYPSTQVIVCDDGLQHYGLFRDVEVCVFDDRGCGNGWTLPAGPLRQAWPRQAVKEAGQDNAKMIVLHTGANPSFEGLRGYRKLANFALRKDGSKVPWNEIVQPELPLWQAVAGTSQPEEFFAMLRAGGIAQLATLALPDHYDFDSLPRNIREAPSLICTEKDAVKLWKIAPHALAVPLLFTAEPDFYIRLDAAVDYASAAKLSSDHGHTTS